MRSSAGGYDLLPFVYGHRDAYYAQASYRRDSGEHERACPHREERRACGNIPSVRPFEPNTTTLMFIAAVCTDLRCAGRDMTAGAVGTFITNTWNSC